MLSARKCLVSVCLPLTVLAVFGVARAAGGNKLKKGVKSSDPRLAGTRDMNYDHLIIAGQRIGPVSLGGLVMNAVNHLGNPDEVYRSTFRGYGYTSDEVYYYYRKSDCINFVWQDSGIDPRIENGLRGINVWCDKWSTPDGLHVGSSMQEVSAHLGRYCPTTGPGGALLILTKEGIEYWAKDRNSPVTQITILPANTDYFGACKD